MRQIAERIAARIYGSTGCTVDVMAALPDRRVAPMPQGTDAERAMRERMIRVAREYVQEADVAVSDVFTVPGRSSGVVVLVRPQDGSGGSEHFLVVTTGEGHA